MSTRLDQPATMPKMKPTPRRPKKRLSGGAGANLKANRRRRHGFRTNGLKSRRAKRRCRTLERYRTTRAILAPHHPPE